MKYICFCESTGRRKIADKRGGNNKEELSESKTSHSVLSLQFFSCSSLPGRAKTLITLLSAAAGGKGNLCTGCYLRCSLCVKAADRCVYLVLNCGDTQKFIHLHCGECTCHLRQFKFLLQVLYFLFLEPSSSTCSKLSGR